MKPVVQAFNESIGSYVWAVVRKASEIIEPHVARPDRLSIHDE
jgi:hypothetical protein